MILVSIFIIFIYLKKYVDIFFAFYGDYKNLKKKCIREKNYMEIIKNTISYFTC